MNRHDVGGSVDGELVLEVLSLLSKKWQPVVLVHLIHRGPMGFNELLEAIPEISGKVLTETLGTLRETGLVRRNVLSESPLRVEYELTDTGHDMKPVFEALTIWGNRHLKSTAPAVVLAGSDRRITDMYGAWLSDQYNVIQAHTDADLRAQLDSDPDILLVDEGLPGGTFRRIHETADPPCRTVVLVGDRPEVNLLDTNCDEILRKPIVRKTMLEVIQRQLERRDEPPRERERAALENRLSFFQSLYSHDQLATTEAYTQARNRLDELEE
ncbi:winged helix-turn-helix transcriptional regulator [Natronosalvus halobius]|uniref:winged helix-turn-helix transcriptional regulator n=1 Tax=Natronosalvus halobius TaxID=2953746 RepID=UPI00209EF98A|nr:winged helix-turn-helix transcriptional regulator [Natronosalvus halobius]USZ71488.1 winged helix-turn-helix transcriptional regulator [Natronosalvus halobius]